jgi:mRNA interferase HigB
MPGMPGAEVTSARRLVTHNAIDWVTPADIKRGLGSASILRGGRMVFNIAGNKYRLVVWINYAYRVVYIRFIGTHVQYDAIDAQII